MTSFFIVVVFTRTDIERRDCFLLVLTPDSVLSSMCDFELDNAQKQGKRIIPVVARVVDYRSVRKGVLSCIRYA